MKTYIVCVSDSSGSDRRAPVIVEPDASLGKVAQMAMDEFVAVFGEDVEFPLFVDIHPAEQFSNVYWLHSRPQTQV